MEMDDSTESGSLSGNPESYSPPLSGAGDYSASGGGGAPRLINVNISAEHAPAVESGGGAVSGGGFPGGGPSGGPGGGNGDLTAVKKKRGRPRKYDAEGNLNPAYIKSPPLAAAQPPPQAGFTLSTPPSYEYSVGPKRGRGKHHSGHTSWPVLASLGELFANTAGGDFTPHVVTVHTGEDVAGKILTFAQKDHRGICVLSANGSVSNVTLRQPGSSGGLLTYEGRFEILTLTGSYTISDNGGMRSRSGGLSVTLASPDGRVIGGGVAGLLMAASPIQIVVGTFVPNGFKVPKRKYQTEPKSVPTSAPATITAARPISQAPPEIISYPAQKSQFLVGPQNPGSGQTDSSFSHKGLQNPAPKDTAKWNGPGPGSAHRPSPDINISIPFDEH
ncbi:AT-hook motif nuclear-localized protein 1 [Striga hermonthica]|uniref:AT-hook motif nuclear-localized protein n=1 Tax=Striga hermonthica TaxID=68872 RepID=A0A9N7P570_STRHE|nr:AT-hook motif nuclear-localized protein 1 [Striga hermonthica]